jgi:phosphoribosylformylglycinamidine synthase subunit PurS
MSFAPRRGGLKSGARPVTKLVRGRARKDFARARHEARSRKAFVTCGIINERRGEKQSLLERSHTSLKAKVYVTLKQGVLDPQGKAIQHSVELLGFDGIEDVRQGKYFEIALDGTLDETSAREAAERMAKDVLSNPVIEDYRVEIER